MTRPLLSPDALEAALRDVGAQRYHNLHPFHRRLHSGGCRYEEVQAWALNRYVYQSTIPTKDATVLARMGDASDRREWRRRLEDHDGAADGEGGIERWLNLTDSLGFARDYVMSTRGALPATRFAVEAYVTFCAQRSLLEAVASSLTELFSPGIIQERVAGMLAHYDFVSRDTLAYFSARPPQASRDSDFALAFVKRHADTREKQDLVVAALVFKTDVLWAQLDALWGAYVEGAIPPGGVAAGHGAGTRRRMSRAPLEPQARPRLPRGVRLRHDAVRDEWHLLAPERVVKANGVAVEILKRCDGAATLDGIVDDLASVFVAERARIETDVRALLADLRDKQMVEW